MSTFPEEDDSDEQRQSSPNRKSAPSRKAGQQPEPEQPPDDITQRLLQQKLPRWMRPWRVKKRRMLAGKRGRRAAACSACAADRCARRIEHAGYARHRFS